MYLTSQEIDDYINGKPMKWYEALDSLDGPDQEVVSLGNPSPITKGKTMNVEDNKPVVDQPLETKRDYIIDDNGDVTLDSVTIDSDGPVEIFVQAKEDFEGASPVNR